ncbi:hypothetical protein EDC40_101488 [Aminobacter aminovorans]|uniref:Uncharacterized protein n=1 Tax=Aminobacter aminovorans TaxID=83263 RepID=A0A380WPZ9_AMIAI|nr:hypothetical protein EDC40_101488 [Aminobacter aminovorans]SUU91019.1 Uncharacterised protein [Aminobacter aminovorans]
MLTFGNVGDGDVWQGCIRGHGLNLDVMPFDHEHARSVGRLRADRNWADLDVGCRIEVIR